MNEPTVTINQKIERKPDFQTFTPDSFSRDEFC